MDETIGVKGGNNDRRRSLVITKKRLKKLKLRQKLLKKKKLEELEKKVKRLQIVTFFKATSLILSGLVFKTIFDNSKKNQNIKKINIDMSNEKQNATENKKNNIDTPDVKVLFIRDILNINNVVVKKDNLKKADKNDNKVLKEKEEIKKNKVNDELQMKTEVSKKEKKENNIETKKNIFQNNTSISIVAGINQDKRENRKDKDKNNDNGKNVDIPKKEKDKIISKGIIEKYQEELKQIRTELKKIISEYDENQEYADNAEELLEKVKLVIEKLDLLAESIKVSDVMMNDYYYDLIMYYTSELNDPMILNELKDSDLYYLLSQKIGIMNDKTDKLRYELSQKKSKTDDIEKVDTFEFKKFSEKLDKFQEEQKKIIRKTEKEVKKAKTVSRRILNKMIALRMQVLSLLLLMATMRRPSVRNSKAAAISTLATVYFMNQILKDKYDDSNKKEVLDTDYIKAVESNLDDINSTLSLISVTSGKLDKLINDITAEFSDYLELDECQELLNSLYSVRKEIKEKEYEINSIMEQQEKSLNNKRKILDFNN